MEKPITRTTQGLRDMVFDEIELFQRGETDVVRLAAISKTVDSICKTIALDLRAQELIKGNKKLIENNTDESKNDEQASQSLNLNLALSASDGRAAYRG